VYFKQGQPATRCDTVENHQKRKCKTVSDPKSGFNANENKKFDSTTNVTPQNLTLRLRKGQPAKFNVSMRTPEDFPVDLYYLMDLSGSMFQDMKRITTLGTRIGNYSNACTTEMSKITRRFRLGFGTFVDKPLAPFIDTHPSLLEHPNILPGGIIDKNSTAAFSYRNSLSLDYDISKFEKKVAEQNISGNVDNPEGGLDALVQVAVCHKDIGWEKKESARRLVVFTTDAAYHFAGDGLLGGVVSPNDGKCHLRNGEYIAATLMEVRKFFGEESFAVAAELSSDGSNIVTLIREAYEKIAKTQTISDNSTEGVTVQYKAICPDGIYENKNICNDVKIGETVTFEVSVTAEKCSPDMPDRVHLRTAFGDVALKLEYICDCACEELEYQVLKSKHCSTNGTLICGLCDCDVEWSGRLCDCESGKQFDQSLCPKSNTTGQICTGRGDCMCGECQCKESQTPGEKFYGKNCECSNMDCPRNKDDVLCGGPEQGTCDCGKCHCYGNWTGPSCSCTTEIDGCMNDGGCLGHCEANKDCVHAECLTRDTRKVNVGITDRWCCYYVSWLINIVEEIEP
ncbi:hypothetical protein QZH41_015654, partial [Actinostola sp. cb2023]